jgi:DNA-directed RNA polymerase subunit beta'
MKSLLEIFAKYSQPRQQPLLEVFRQFTAIERFGQIENTMDSPEGIRRSSYGEVKNPHAINSRTGIPERDGMFCAKIFGPIKDYECICGKYKGQQHRGVICERCGVEIQPTSFRGERMGHIELVAPCSYIWFVKSVPSFLGLVLDMTVQDIELVLYFKAYIVTAPGTTPLKKFSIMLEDDFDAKFKEYGDEFQAKMGAEGIKDLLQSIDIEGSIEKLRNDLTGSELKIKKNAKRLQIFESFLNFSVRPEWLMLDVLPVLPPNMRPLVPLGDGRFVFTDVSDLYRSVINRNISVKRLLETKAPEIMLRNEKRHLQEAVDSLLDNGRSGITRINDSKVPLKSLADMD